MSGEELFSAEKRAHEVRVAAIKAAAVSAVQAECFKVLPGSEPLKNWLAALLCWLQLSRNDSSVAGSESRENLPVFAEIISGESDIVWDAAVSAAAAELSPNSGIAAVESKRGPVIAPSRLVPEVSFTAGELIETGFGPWALSLTHEACRRFVLGAPWISALPLFCSGAAQEAFWRALYEELCSK